MTSGAGRQGTGPAARRRGVLVAAASAALLLGGGTAVTVGLLTQQDSPTPVAATAASAGGGSEAPPTTGGHPNTVRSTPLTSMPAARPPVGGQSTRPRPTSSKPPAAAVPPPVRLRIPAIGVDTALIVVGLNPDGSLAAPQPGPDYDKAAWFEGSPAPGAVGPAVIEGHVDSAANGPSVFFELAALKPGDQIHIDRADGSTVTFAVDHLASYPKTGFPRLPVYGNTTGPELRLITCGGDYDPDVGSYLNNTVVYAH